MSKKRKIAKAREKAIISRWLRKEVVIVSADIDEVVIQDISGNHLIISTEILTGKDSDDSILTFGDLNDELGFFSRYNHGD